MPLLLAIRGVLGGRREVVAIRESCPHGNRNVVVTIGSMSSHCILVVVAPWMGNALPSVNAQAVQGARRWLIQMTRYNTKQVMSLVSSFLGGCGISAIGIC
jgi:hypothetical protein